MSAELEARVRELEAARVQFQTERDAYSAQYQEQFELASLHAAKSRQETKRAEIAESRLAAATALLGLAADTLDEHYPLTAGKLRAFLAGG